MGDSPTLVPSGAPAGAIAGGIAPGELYASNRPGFGTWLRAVVQADRLLAWADQCLVSANSFIVLAVIAWVGDLSQVGIYAACGAVLTLALAVQDALIARPYAIELHRPIGSSAGHASATLVLSLLLSGGISGGLAAVALAMWIADAPAQWVVLAWTVALSTIPVMLREYGRRYAFAHLKVRLALLLDAAAVTVNVGLLACLAWARQLDAATALTAQGVSCLTGAAIWLAAARGEHSASLRSLRAAARRSWAMGKWLLATQVAVQVQGYTSHWLSLVALGAASAGIYTACASTVALANPFVFGLINLMVPHSARAFVREGGPGVTRQAARDALALGAVMSAVCAVLALVGDDLMATLFRGSGGHGSLLLALGVASTVACIGVPASVALASADHARAVAIITAVTAVLNLGLAWSLMPVFGLGGLVAAALAAETVGTIGRWAALLALVHGTKPRARGAPLPTTRKR